MQASDGFHVSSPRIEMGSSFYSVLEYEQWGAYWAFARLNIPRDPELFSAIALGDGSIADGLPYPPRGVPPDCSFEAREMFFAPAAAVREFLAAAQVEGEELLTLNEYVRGFGEWAVVAYRSDSFLPTPETHSHGWLNLQELGEALARRGLSVEKLSPAFRAVLAAMQELAREFGADKVRLVFGLGM